MSVTLLAYPSVSQAMNVKKELANKKNSQKKLSQKAKTINSEVKSLKRDLQGFYSIRINDQWRIIFIWSDAGPHDVRITDYH